MAAIVKKPDALSLSGNMTPFVVFVGVGSVSFTLLKGAETLISQSYECGPDGNVTIDVRDVIESSLSFTLNAENNSYQQTNFATFKAIIDDLSHEFTVIRAGVANLADTAANFLKLHFLTWQPRVKRVTYYTPEWLTYYAVSASSLRLKATFPDETTAEIHLCSIPAGTAMTANVQYAYIAGLLGHRYPTHYEVWATAGSTKVSESLFYAYAEPAGEDEQWFLFENSLGGIDSFRAFGVNALNAEHEHQIAEMGDSRQEFRIDTERKYTKNTGHLDDYERRWMLDFFPSRAKYIYDATAIRKIIVSEDNATYKSADLPSSYTFTFQFAELSAYLNLQRNEEDIPSQIVVPDLSQPDFILPPRLIEFPRVQLSEGVLLPAFEPHNSQPTVTTFGEIHDTIYISVADYIEEVTQEIGKTLEEIKENGLGNGSGGSGGGGDFPHLTSTDQLTPPSDLNAFTSLRTLLEINKSLSALDERYLRKDINDTAHGYITFDAGWMTYQPVRSAVYNVGWEEETPAGFYITETGNAWFSSLNIRGPILGNNIFGSPYFASGWTGFGTQLDFPKSYLELDHLLVRKSLKVYELVVNQVRGTNGSLAVTDTNKIESVEDMGIVWRCYIDDMDGEMYMNLRTGDVVRCQTWEQLSGRYYCGVISRVGDKWFEIRKTLLEGEDSPAAGDVVVRWSNTTDPDRQGLLYLTSSDSYNPYLDVRYGEWDATIGSIKARLGRLDGINDPAFPELYSAHNNFGLYTNNFYGTGELILRSTGESVSRTFDVLRDSIKMGLSEIRYEMQVAKESVLQNPVFNDDTQFWNFTTITYAWLNESRFMYANGGAFQNFISGAKLTEDPLKVRTVLQVADATVTQKNTAFNTHEPGKYAIRFSYRSLLPFGKIEVGIPGTSLFISRPLSETSAWLQAEIIGDWDGTGDFTITVSGGVANITDISFAPDALANAINDLKVEYETKLTFYAEKAVMESFRAEYDEFNVEVRRDYATQVWTHNKIQSDVGTIVNGKLVNYSTITQTANQISGVVSQINTVDSRVDDVKSDINQMTNYINSAGWKTEATGNLLWAKKDMEKGGTIISTINQTPENVTIGFKHLDAAVTGITDAFYRFSADNMSLNRRIELGSGTASNFMCQSGIAPQISDPRKSPAFWAGGTFGQSMPNNFGDVTAGAVITHDGSAWFSKNKIKFDANGHAEFQTLRVKDFSDTNVLCVDWVVKLPWEGYATTVGGTPLAFSFSRNTRGSTHYYEITLNSLGQHGDISRVFFIAQGLYNAKYDGAGYCYVTVEKISDTVYRFYPSDDASTNPRDILVMMCRAPGWVA